MKDSLLLSELQKKVLGENEWADLLCKNFFSEEN